jgi:hypothetical protein
MGDVRIEVRGMRDLPLRFWTWLTAADVRSSNVPWEPD